MRDKISDEYCDTAMEGKIRELKNVGVPVADIIQAFNRAALRLQHDEWQRKEGK